MVLNFQKKNSEADSWKIRASKFFRYRYPRKTKPIFFLAIFESVFGAKMPQPTDHETVKKSERREGQLPPFFFILGDDFFAKF